MNVREALEFAKKNRVQVVDLKFVDLIGTWQHFTIPASELTEDLFKDGSGLDGSSIRGWKAINNSDMLVVPDPATACLDPFTAVPTLSLIGNVVDPISRETYERDPRYIAQKAEKYLQSTKLGDTSYWGPEAEFFIFDHARYDQTSHSGYYHIDSDEGVWNMGQDGVNLGGKIRHKEGYFPVPPTDTQQDIRTEMILEMEKVGIAVEKHHHEVATAGQAEIDIRFDSLVRTADKMMMYKYIVKNVARRHGKTVTFMPKPLFGDNGSGMHTHQSIWKEGKPLFAGKEYAGVSQMCLHYIGGILKHAPALRRSPIRQRTPTSGSRRDSKRLCCWPTPAGTGPPVSGFRCTPESEGEADRGPFPRSGANPYLAFSAMLMAGLDGIENKINPGEPAEKDLYDLEAKEAAKIRTMPGSLDEALSNLEKDHKFLLKGGVFTEDLIESWIGYKRSKEVDPMRLRPHPYEFFLYYDI